VVAVLLYAFGLSLSEGRPLASSGCPLNPSRSRACRVGQRRLRLRGQARLAPRDRCGWECGEVWGWQTNQRLGGCGRVY